MGGRSPVRSRVLCVSLRVRACARYHGTFRNSCPGDRPCRDSMRQTRHPHPLSLRGPVVTVFGFSGRALGATYTLVCPRRRRRGLASCKLVPLGRVCERPHAHCHHGVAVFSLEDSVAGAPSGPLAVGSAQSRFSPAGLAFLFVCSSVPSHPCRLLPGSRGPVATSREGETRVRIRAGRRRFPLGRPWPHGVGLQSPGSAAARLPQRPRGRLSVPGSGTLRAVELLLG